MNDTPDAVPSQSGSAGRGEPLPPPLTPLADTRLPPPTGGALPPPNAQAGGAGGQRPAAPPGNPVSGHTQAAAPQPRLPPPAQGRPMASPASVAQSAARPAPQPQVRQDPAPRAAPPAAAPKSKKEGVGVGRIVWIFVVLGFVVAGGIAAGSVLSGLDAVVVVEERGEAMPDWMPYAVAGGVVLAGLIAFMVGGPRPELLASWAGLALVTYGSGLGLDRIEELATSDVATGVLTQLDSTESLMLAGAGLVLLGQVLAIRRFFRPRPIAAVRALLGTGLLSALAIALALTTVLHAGVESGV